MGEAIFPDEYRIEKVIEEAIRYFDRERSCRIFNLSIGIKWQVYQGGRQFPLAEMLDELARELDIVIVISAGNRPDPPIPEGVVTREQFQQAVRDQLIEKEQRVCNPATAALALTVGAIARNAALGSHQPGYGVSLPNAFAGAPENAPAPFTRTGPGYAIDQTKAGIKPDVVQYGGNFALQTLAGGVPRWATSHILLGEPTIKLEQNGRFLGSSIGTSFACPHVTHAAAVAATSLEASLGRTPSANLIRALIGSATVLPGCGTDWLKDEHTALSLVGYGMCAEEDVGWSRGNRVHLVAMDALEENKLHIYRVPIPEVFLVGRGRRGITIALAYDPPVRSSRKEYLARTMWFEAYQGLTADQVEEYRAYYYGEKPPSPPPWADIELRPTRTQVMWSTLQVRKKEWRRPRRMRIPPGEDSPVIHLLVGCQQRFPTGLDPKRRYGLVVLFWHEEDRIELYQYWLRALGITRIRLELQV